MSAQTQTCRDRFKDMGLTNEIAKNNLDILVEFIKEEIEQHNAEGSGIFLSLDEKIEIVSRKDMKNKTDYEEIYLTVSGEYFKNRQAISFEYDGWIGFCGWASSANQKPFLNAFNRWLDIIKEKNGKN